MRFPAFGVYERPVAGEYIQITVPTGSPIRAPIQGRVEGIKDPPIALKRSGEDELIVPLSTFGGIRISLSEFLRELPGLETALLPLIATGKVVTRGRELLQRFRGSLSNFQGEVVVRGNRGGERVSVKLTAATQRAARAKEVARAA